MKSILELSSALLELSIALTLFVAFLFGTAFVLPYILTYESYDSNSEANPMLRVAVLDQGKPAILRWSEYDKSEHILYSPETEEKIQLGAYEFFVIKPENDSIQLSLYLDDYQFYSEYKIDNQKAEPSSFYYTGAFIFLYSLPLSFLLVGLAKFCWKRYIMSPSTKVPAAPDERTARSL